MELPALPTIPKVYLIAGLVIVSGLLFLGIAGSYKIAYDKGEKSGMAQCVAGYNAAAVHQQDESQRRIFDVHQRLQTAEDEILSAPASDDGPVAAVLASELRRANGIRSVRASSPGTKSP